jgi:hypothetical protein
MTSSLAIVEIRAWAGGGEAPLKRQCSLGERAEIYRQTAEKSRGDGVAPGGKSWDTAIREANGQTEPLPEMLTRERLHPVAITAINQTNRWRL